MTVTLEWWMAVPLVTTCWWLGVAIYAEDRDTVGFTLIGWLAMIVPALLVAWLK